MCWEESLAPFKVLFRSTSTASKVQQALLLAMLRLSDVVTLVLDVSSRRDISVLVVVVVDEDSDVAFAVSDWISLMPCSMLVKLDSSFFAFVAFVGLCLDVLELLLLDVLDDLLLVLAVVTFFKTTAFAGTAGDPNGMNISAGLAGLPVEMRPLPNLIVGSLGIEMIFQRH